MSGGISWRPCLHVAWVAMPLRRQRQTVFRHRTGSTALDTTGDELADAVVADSLRASPDERALLARGMLNGSWTIPDAPLSFRRFITDAEAAISSCSSAALRQASETYLAIGPIWLTISLGPGALVHTYSDPGIAAVLARTGNLIGQAAARRLLETQLWNVQVVRPAGLLRGGSGYVQTLQVRLLHAKVRAALMKSPSFEHSTAIDQRQMVRTWLDFTLVSFTALSKAGFIFPPEHMNSVYCMWRLIGRLLGVAPQHLEQVQDAEAAAILLHEIDRAVGSPDENSRKLTRAMLDVIGVRLASVFGLPGDVARLLADTFCRLFHGEALSSQLGVAPNWTASLLPLFQDANRGRMCAAAADPTQHSLLLERARADFAEIEQAMSDPATFRRTVELLANGALPVVGHP